MTNEKLDQTRTFLRRTVDNYKSPALMCSFGKDSMVMLHIMRGMGIRVPVVFFRDPWMSKKYVFAQRVAAEWDLDLYDWSPVEMSMWEGETIMAYTSHYQIGAGTMLVPKNILPPVGGERFACGLDDVIRRPLGTFSAPWDALIIGHKDSDEDQIAGKVKLKCDIRSGGRVNPDLVFPMRQWTDDDIWQYTEDHGVPQQWDRYDAKSRREFHDKSTNSDYARVCIECIDRRKLGQTVSCPKLGVDVTNVSQLVNYKDVKLDYFGK